MTTTTQPTPTAGPTGAQGGPESARPSTQPRTDRREQSQRRPQLSDAERRIAWEAYVEETKTEENMWKALATGGYLTDVGVICPKCGKGPLRHRHRRRAR